MRRTGRLLLLLLGAAALSTADEPEIRLPKAAQAHSAPAAGAAVVHLTRDGEIRVDRDGRLESVSLDQLAGWLRGRRESFEGAAGEKGGSSAASGLTVVLRADRDAPWQHVQWILGACAHEHLAHIELAAEAPGGKEGTLRVDPRADLGRVPKELVRISVAILVKNEVLATWGPTQAKILKPTEIVYKMLDREAPEIEAVRRFIRDAHQAASAIAGVRIVGEIDAEARIAYADVIAVLDEFHHAGLTDVRFRGVALPPEAQRREPKLSYPGK